MIFKIGGASLIGYQSACFIDFTQLIYSIPQDHQSSIDHFNSKFMFYFRMLVNHHHSLSVPLGPHSRDLCQTRAVLKWMGADRIQFYTFRIIGNT